MSTFPGPGSRPMEIGSEMNTALVNAGGDRAASAFIATDVHVDAFSHCGDRSSGAPIGPPASNHREWRALRSLTVRLCDQVAPLVGP